MELYCKNCGQKIKAIKIHSGKTYKCPKCKQPVSVPEQEENLEKKYSADELSFLNIRELEHIRKLQTQELQAQEEAADQKEKSKESEFSQERKHHWFVDILLYPTSPSGLKHLAIFTGIPLLISILGMIVPIQLSCLFGLVTMVVNITLFLYLYWYLAECIRDSVDGWVRAPEGMGGLPEMADMFMQTVNIIGCLAFFFGPFFYCTFVAKRTDIVFWLLLFYAVIFFPMALLIVVVHDSVAALSPRLLIKSIHVTFRLYCGLVFVFLLMVVLVSIAVSRNQESLFWNFLCRFTVVYLLLVCAHLFGRFYWRQKGRLKWKNLNEVGGRTYD